MKAVISLCLLIALSGCGQNDPEIRPEVPVEESPPVESVNDYTIAELLAHFEKHNMPLRATVITNGVEAWGTDLAEVATLRYQEKQTLKVHYLGTIWRVKNHKTLKRLMKHAEHFGYTAFFNGLTAITLDEADEDDEARIETIFALLGNESEEEPAEQSTGE